MQRLVLTGEDLSGYAADAKGSYFKLFFNMDGSAMTDTGQVLNLSSGRPVMRTYTIRDVDQNTGALTVDFVLHGEGEGPASTWAASAQPGDRIVISNPGPIKAIDPAADWCLLAGDMTALPAISCNLEALPATAKGYVVLEVESEADKQALAVPEGVEVIWIINSNHRQPQSVLLEAVKKLEWLEGQPYVWAACEFSSMRQLRRYFKDDRKVPRESMYISSYWKLGLAEEQHKIAKKKDQAASMVQSLGAKLFLTS